MPDFGFILPYLSLLVQGTLLTVVLFVISMLLGCALGLCAVLVRLMNGVVVNRVIDIAVNFIRGTPVLVQLLCWYLIPQALGYSIPPFLAVVLALGVNAAAFISEIVKGAILAIPTGQREAALSIGLTKLYSILAIELPQALPAIVPSLIGFAISLIKDTSLAYVVGIYELTRTGKIIADREFNPIEVFILISLVYFAFCYPLSRVAKVVDQQLQKRGLAQAKLSV